MLAGRLEYSGGARTLCEFYTRHINSDYQGGIPRLIISLSPEKTFPIEVDGIDYKTFAAINCDGTAKLSNVNVGYIKGPSFFRMLPGGITFIIELSREQINMIESSRQFRDVEVDLDLQLLVSFNKEYLFNFNYVVELPLRLHVQINKSVWVEEFLKNWSYYEGNEKMLRFNYLFKLPNTSKLIISARKSFSENKFNDTLATCFKVLEAIPKEMGFKNPNLFFEELRVKASNHNNNLYGKVDFVNELYGKIKGFMHIARHVETDEDKNIIDRTISSSDAFLALHCTELIVNYLIESIANEET
ncbi:MULTISPECIES: hypothetical protein [Cohnella]|uniref:Uncharacterized protein n=1 Tax=Cohnella fermenti TaxID=2565925 RepID=A0A4S4BL46_9BACL|nr:hypothetical protein [Cohnella fermenti]THF75385.1 hypothetical protein E6C55_22335 [Cohnella fermenti]